MLPQISQEGEVALGGVGDGEGDVLTQGLHGDDAGVVVGGDGGVGAAVADVGASGFAGAFGQARHLPILDVQRVDGIIHLRVRQAGDFGDAVAVAAQCLVGLGLQAARVQSDVGGGVLAVLEQAGEGVLEFAEAGEGRADAHLGQNAEYADDDDEREDEAEQGLDDLVHGGSLLVKVAAVSGGLKPAPTGASRLEAGPAGSSWGLHVPSARGGWKGAVGSALVLGFGESVFRFDGAAAHGNPLGRSSIIPPQHLQRLPMSHPANTHEA